MYGENASEEAVSRTGNIVRVVGFVPERAPVLVFTAILLRRLRTVLMDGIEITWGVEVLSCESEGTV